VTEPLAYLLVGLAAVVAVWAGALTVLNRRMDNPLFYAAAVVEVALVATMVGGFIALATTDRDVDGVTFGGYLLTIVLIVPIGVAWGASDKSRWGTGVVVIAALVVVVLAWRLLQIWQGTSV
jgi:uncharacterized membrane protein